jgi:hypothetical protein
MIKDLLKLANRLDSKGMTKEADVLDLLIKKIAQQDDTYLGYDPRLEVYPDPGLDEEAVKAAYYECARAYHFDLDVLSAKWNDEPSEYPHYVVTYSSVNPNGKWDPTLGEFVGPPHKYIGKNEFVEVYEGHSGYDKEVKDSNGKSHYFYAEH